MTPTKHSAARTRRPTICDGVVYDWRTTARDGFGRRSIHVSASRNGIVVHEAEIARDGAGMNELAAILDEAYDAHLALDRRQDPYPEADPA